jgi:hypothetical protein
MSTETNIVVDIVVSRDWTVFGAFRTKYVCFSPCSTPSCAHIHYSNITRIGIPRRRTPATHPRTLIVGCCLKIHLYILTEVQHNNRNRFQHVVRAAATIWDYLFHGIPLQQRVFTRQIRVHMFGIISPSRRRIALPIPTFSFWRHTARQFSIQYIHIYIYIYIYIYSCSTPGRTECI